MPSRSKQQAQERAKLQRELSDRKSPDERYIENKTKYKMEQYSRPPTGSERWPDHPFSGRKDTHAEKLDTDIRDYTDKKKYALTGRGTEWPLPPATPAQKQKTIDDHADAVIEREYHDMAQRRKAKGK